MNTKSLLYTWFGCLIGCLPLLALFLVPQLMRSRAGDERLLLAGTTLLLLLLVSAFALAPVMSSWFSPIKPIWEPRTALRSARTVWRRSTRGAVGALAVGIAVYAAGQAVGYAIGAIVPYVSDNPAHINDPTQSPWLIHYPEYALQASFLYVTTAFAVAVYSWRIRALRQRS